MNRDDGTITKDNVSSLTYGRYPLKKYDPKQCAAEAADTSNSRWTHYAQCSRKPGFGTDCLFCKQHAKAEITEIKKAFSIKSVSAGFSCYKDNYEIEEVSITKFTDQSVFIVSENGEVRREARHGTYNIFFPTKEEAIGALIKRAENNIKNSKQSISLAEEFLNSLKNES